MITELEKQMAEALEAIKKNQEINGGRIARLSTVWHIAERALIAYREKLEQEQNRVDY